MFVLSTSLQLFYPSDAIIVLFPVITTYMILLYDLRICAPCYSSKHGHGYKRYSGLETNTHSNYYLSQEALPLPFSLALMPGRFMSITTVTFLIPTLITYSPLPCTTRPLLQVLAARLSTPLPL